MSKKLTVNEVVTHVENILNDGRKVKLRINPATTSPANVLAKLNGDDIAKLDILGQYRGISANNYTVQASMLWTSLFWKIGEQILLVSNFNNPFARFYSHLDVGADIEEVAPRIKAPLDRTTLANSAILANHTTTYDSFYHRINKFLVFASTYDRYEVERLSNSWTNVTNMINAEMENLLLSASTYLLDHSKASLSTAYLSGMFDSVTIPVITNADTAATAAITINNAIDRMTVEPNTSYIPFNRNATNPNPTIRDIANSPICFIGLTDLFNNVQFRSALNLYFGNDWENGKFQGNVIKVTDWANTINPDIQITPGYTPLATPQNIVGFLVEENGFIFREKQIGTFNFDNGATLKTSIFQHMDVLANISDRRKVVAIVQ